MIYVKCFWLTLWLIYTMIEALSGYLIEIYNTPSYKNLTGRCNNGSIQ